MPKKVITQEHISEMKRLGTTMTAKQISTLLGLKYNTVVEYMSKHAMARRLGKTRRVPDYKREKEQSGVFNVNAVENWLI